MIDDKFSLTSDGLQELEKYFVGHKDPLISTRWTQLKNEHISNASEKVRSSAITECRNILGNKLIHGVCDEICDTCFLCDNTGGCITSPCENHTEGKIDLYKKALILKSKEWGVDKHVDGTQSFKLKISFEGAVSNTCNDIEDVCEAYPECETSPDKKPYVDTFSIKEAARLYKEGRDAWMNGDFETVAELFGVLV